MTHDPPASLAETHSAVLVLMGDRSYKVKKPVDPRVPRLLDRGNSERWRATARSASTARWPTTCTSASPTSPARTASSATTSS